MEITHRFESRCLGSENGRAKNLLWGVISIALSLQAGALAFSREAPGGPGGPLTAVQSNGDDSKLPAAARRTRNEELVGDSGSRNQQVESKVPTRLGEGAGASGRRVAGNRSYFALLVGCTDYQLSGIPELWGPTNDVAEWANLLVNRFGFPAANVTSLVGWPEDAAKRPTRANIGNAVDAIHARSKPGDQVVIVLNGHGSQVPSPKTRQVSDHVEADGFDEVFLPADVRSWTREGIENGILDDEIGRGSRDFSTREFMFGLCSTAAMRLAWPNLKPLAPRMRISAGWSLVSKSWEFHSMPSGTECGEPRRPPLTPGL